MVAPSLEFFFRLSRSADDCCTGTERSDGGDHVSLVRVKRALLSVSNKLGLVSFAEGLQAAGVELIATGRTHAVLVDAGIRAVEVAEYTGFPEILDGRVKTLHPRVFAGILARRDNPEHMATLQKLGIAPIDLVAVNLYPFEWTVAQRGVTLEQALEQIDIGGPSLVRAAAKNFPFVVVVTDPDDYAEVLGEIERYGGVTEALRRRLAVKAFTRTSAYDQVISGYLARGAEQNWCPENFTTRYKLRAVLRYGENPQQKGAMYAIEGYDGPSICTARQVHGKHLSYNNALDLDAGLRLVAEFAEPTAVVIKHQNPCGVASAADLATAFVRAYEADPVSAYGCVLALNRSVDLATAEAIAAEGRFVEAIVAPMFEHEAVDLLTTRPSWRKNVRLIEVGPLAQEIDPEQAIYWELRSVLGGLLVQTPDVATELRENWRVVTEREPDQREWTDLVFAWTVVKHVKSNAIVLAKDKVAVGIGAGQMNRADAVDIAVRKAAQRAEGAVLASDAFFPFRDGPDRAAAAGVTAIIQPGGSRRDQESIDACNEHGMAMVFTGRRHFRH